MRELFSDLPEHTHRTFKKHFLKSVHCELGFKAISTDAILSRENSLKEKLSPLGFKDSKKLHQANFVLNQRDDNVHVSNKSTALGLVFSSATPKRELQILNDKLVISDHAYKGFSTFLPAFKEIASYVMEALSLSDSITKTGLRKINSIVVDEATTYKEAVEIFNPVVFGIPDSGLLAQDALKGMENVTVAEKNKKTFILRARVAKQAQPNTFQNTLDFDLVNKNVHTVDEVFSGLLLDMNQVHFDLFMWAVTEDLIKVMEAE